ncbi:sulfotransferase family protein [Acuticoccus sediminis]|uniref:sulfotransferase family protein n=1 Tax=Acuticoccus sediminis TaxID=2184697 RepID=UPI001CFE7DDC|nr:sulfotransferase family protein [Acuticoccus sediminis]
MPLHVIGVGLGRTGTYSLRIALETLGFGPCFHMEEVARNLPVQLPLWNDVMDGKPDWPTIYAGYESAVDWPTACFYRELNAAYPDARFILGVRDPRSWAESFGETIHKITFDADAPPERFREWLAMVRRVILRSGIPADADKDALAAAFVAHNDAVKAAIPADRLLVYAVKDGWEPLCAFLGLPVPKEPFPRTNNREEFWDLIKSLS